MAKLRLVTFACGDEVKAPHKNLMIQTLIPLGMTQIHIILDNESIRKLSTDLVFFIF